jgi:hypothetical protein
MALVEDDNTLFEDMVLDAFQILVQDDGDAAQFLLIHEASWLSVHWVL